MTPRMGGARQDGHVRAAALLLPVLVGVVWVGAGSRDDDRPRVATARMPQPESPVPVALPDTDLRLDAISGRETDTEAASPAIAGTTAPGLPPAVAARAARHIAREHWNGGRFDTLVEMLRADPPLRAALVAEYRHVAEADRDSSERLATLLVEASAPGLEALAVDMVRSGREPLRAAGLDLLGRLQAVDRTALATTLDLLTAEADAAVLAETLDVLTIPLAASVAERRDARRRIAKLTRHRDGEVRRRSLALLGRWRDDPDIIDMLHRGLDDADAGVRGAAVFGLAGRERLDAAVLEDLFRLAEDPTEARHVRSGALLALRAQTLPSEDMARLSTTERALVAPPDTARDGVPALTTGRSPGGDR